MSVVFPGSYWPTHYWVKSFWPVADESGPEPEPTILPDVGFVNGLYALILVGDEDGRLIGELTGEIESLSWLLNEFGQARLSLPNSGAALSLLEFGNRLLIYLDNGLPPWAGFIDPPRRWTYDRVELVGYSGERLLTHRLSGRNRVFAGATAGAILAALLAEQAGPAVLERGYIHLGGPTLSETYHYEELYDVARSDLFASAADFAVSGTLENGRIRLRVNVYERRGRDLPNIWLLQGHNVAEMAPEEQGPIVNEWLTAGAGSGWGDVGRLYGSARDDASVARFGLRQGTKVFTNARDQATLDALTAAELADSAEPYVAIALDAINLPPARFADYDIGDRVGVEIHTMQGGLREMRRVVGRAYRPTDGVCETVLI